MFREIVEAIASSKLWYTTPYRVAAESGFRECEVAAVIAEVNGYNSWDSYGAHPAGYKDMPAKVAAEFAIYEKNHVGPFDVTKDLPEFFYAKYPNMVKLAAQ